MSSNSVDTGSTRRALQDELRNEQRRNEQLAQANKELEDKLAAQAIQNKRSGRKRTRLAPVDEEAVLSLNISNDVVEKVGKQLTLLHVLWPEHITDFFHPPQEGDEDYEVRDAEFQTYRLLLPVIARVHCSHSMITDSVVAGARALRSTIRNRFMENIMKDIIDRSDLHAVRRAKQKGVMTDLMQDMSGVSENDAGQRTYERLPPCLSRPRAAGAEWDSMPTWITLFMHPTVPLVMRGIMFGPQACRTPRVARHSLGILWNVTALHAGWMATTVTLIRWFWTHDSELTPLGNRTGIDYQSAWRYYKKLAEGFIKSARATNVRATLTAKVFAHRSNPDDFGGDDLEDADDALDSMERQLAFEDELADKGVFASVGEQGQVVRYELIDPDYRRLALDDPENFVEYLVGKQDLEDIPNSDNEDGRVDEGRREVATNDTPPVQVTQGPAPTKENSPSKETDGEDDGDDAPPQKRLRQRLPTPPATSSQKDS